MSTLTNYDLFRAAMREPLRETLPLIPFFFAGLFVWEAVVMHDRNTGRLLLFSACFAVALWVFIAVIFCCLAFDGLLLLHRQEKSLGFTFEDEGLTEIETNDKWYLCCEGARVLAIRRGFIRRAWKPHRVGNFLWKLRIEDINGKCHIVKAHLSDLEGLIDWLKDGKGKTEQIKETMTAEQAVYHKLFLLNGLTECFDRDLDECLERENPLSDLTLALSTCGGKRVEQVHILNEYILNTAPEQINKDAVFSFVADELRERFEENPDTDLEAFAMLMHDIARDSDWWGEFEPWATMYQMPDFYEAAYKEHIISKACFRSIFRRLLYDKTGTDMVRFVIRRKIAFPGILLPLPESLYINGTLVNGTLAGTLYIRGRVESFVPRSKAYYLETESGSAILHDNGQGFYDLTFKMQRNGKWPAETRFYQKTASGEIALTPFPTGNMVAAIMDEKLETLTKPEQTLALCREFWNGVCEDMDEILYSPYIHEMAEALHEVGATEYEAFLRGMIAQFADVPLPLNDEQIETMRKRINEFNRAETRISKTAMPELRETMALYLVEHLAELENQDKT